MQVFLKIAWSSDEDSYYSFYRFVCYSSFLRLKEKFQHHISCIQKLKMKLNIHEDNSQHVDMSKFVRYKVALFAETSST